MAVGSKIGDWAFKAFTAGLGVATIYLTATFSVNVYRGLAWHNAQSVGIRALDAIDESNKKRAEKEASGDQKTE